MECKLTHFAIGACAVTCFIEVFMKTNTNKYQAMVMVYIPTKKDRRVLFFKPIHFHYFILTVNLRDSVSYLVSNISGSWEISSGLASPGNEGDVLFDKENGNNICSLSYREIIRLSCIISFAMCSSKGRYSPV
jgi:hypothetical protein